MIVNFIGINIFLFSQYKIIICNCIILPLYQLLLALTNTSGTTRKRQWSLYWFIYILFILLEYTHQPVSEISLPFYWGFKCYFFVWCASPTATNGIDILFFSYHVVWTIQGNDYFYESIGPFGDRGEDQVSPIYSRKTVVTFHENVSDRSPPPRPKRKFRRRNQKAGCGTGNKCTCKPIPKTNKSSRVQNLFRRLTNQRFNSLKTSTNTPDSVQKSSMKGAAQNSPPFKYLQYILKYPSMRRAKAVRSKMYNKLKGKFSPFPFTVTPRGKWNSKKYNISETKAKFDNKKSIFTNLDSRISAQMYSNQDTHHCPIQLDTCISERILLMIVNFIAINIFLFSQYKIIICN
ncbi:hypothetical protein SNEBB_003347 [Seison nebaliae]|nr:hypothetical protein SNEBB_003347 [Seison nebaliae]